MPILGLLVYSLLTIALLIGIFNPRLILFQSENPTVWKVVLYWVISVFVTSLFATRFIATLFFYSLPLIWLAILIAGLINPGSILVRSRKPTKLKLAGYWSLITFIIIGLTFSSNRNKSELTSESDLVVANYEIEDHRDMFGVRYIGIEGKVKNSGDVPYSSFDVTAFFLNEEGDVVEVASEYVTKDIFPGMSRKFIIMTSIDVEFSDIRLQVENAYERR